jgi:hypothetical protein
VKKALGGFSIIFLTDIFDDAIGSPESDITSVIYEIMP